MLMRLASIVCVFFCLNINATYIHTYILFAILQTVIDLADIDIYKITF